MYIICIKTIMYTYIKHLVTSSIINILLDHGYGLWTSLSAPSILHIKSSSLQICQDHSICMHWIIKYKHATKTKLSISGRFKLVRSLPIYTVYFLGINVHFVSKKYLSLGCCKQMIWGQKHHSLAQRPLVKLAFITKSILEEKTVIVFS
jgi:hypothetical protein